MAARKSKMAPLETREYHKPVDSSVCRTWIAPYLLSKNTEYCPSSTVGNNKIKTCKNMTKIRITRTITQTYWSNVELHASKVWWVGEDRGARNEIKYNQIQSNSAILWTLYPLIIFKIYQKVQKYHSIAINSKLAKLFLYGWFFQRFFFFFSQYNQTEGAGVLYVILSWVYLVAKFCVQLRFKTQHTGNCTLSCIVGETNLCTFLLTVKFSSVLFWAKKLRIPLS